MERLRILKERFLKFRYRGMLVVTLVFALITAILFIERSGISYNYNKPQLEFLPLVNVITKEEANAALKKNTVLLWDSTQIDSVNAMDEFPQILKDMKVGYDAIDLSVSEFPDLSLYNKAVILISDLSPIGENVITLNDWVLNGGRLQFALTLQKNIYVSVLESAMGIMDSSWGYSLLENIYIDDNFMVGGGS